MRIATFNVASVRARLPILETWLAETEPDIVALQETKVEDHIFPRETFEELGYHVAIHGQKSLNGVAILSKSPPTNVQIGFGDDLWPNDARIIRADIDGVQIINTYVPNGTQVGIDKWDYKMRWLDRFAKFLRQSFDPQQPLIWLGDINIAPQPIDVYDSKKFLGGVGHHPDEFAKLDTIVSFGLTDTFRHLDPESIAHTYWDFVIPRAVDRNLGWRIDHIYVTEPMLSRLESVEVDRGPRTMERPSDHTPVVATFSD